MGNLSVARRPGSRWDHEKVIKTGFSSNYGISSRLSENMSLPLRLFPPSVGRLSENMSLPLRLFPPSVGSHGLEAQ